VLAVTSAPPLFVYGSLKAGQAGHRLLGACLRVAPGQVRGRLFHLPAGYPTLILDPAGDVVRGQVVWLSDPEPTLERLDRYEGHDPRRPERSDYQRVLHTIAVDGEPDVRGWVYALPHGAQVPADAIRLSPEPGRPGVTWSGRVR
jgi:gamma-glutamylcyclotransferase (GGCT)/AIG2-like uncharacterized protein YtfP